MTRAVAITVENHNIGDLVELLQTLNRVGNAVTGELRVTDTWTVSAPAGPGAPEPPAVPHPDRQPAGPVGPLTIVPDTPDDEPELGPDPLPHADGHTINGVHIPPPTPGQRRNWTDDQRRALLDHVARHGIAATADTFDIARSVLARMADNAPPGPPQATATDGHAQPPTPSPKTTPTPSKPAKPAPQPSNDVSLLGSRLPARQPLDHDRLRRQAFQD